jgi:3-hydroxy-9,10-secoandrosta-1,3,5(10)-triene-9,17-dione monooxygenase reductase component
MNSEKYKNIVSKFPTGVTVVTCSYKGALYGFTASSFVSVSLEPLLSSFCISKSAGSIDAFLGCEYFAVNFLSSKQKDICLRFASKSADKFSDLDYGKSNLGSPILPSVLAHIEYSTFSKIDAGDHFIIIGKAVDGNFSEGLTPLAYYNRKFIEDI